ncbi:MAG: Re/Si-specific NAD(P)(+) transhydrogenase subunit alpha [Cyanobacteria bacterium P01_D01_bin.128]
MTIAVDNAPDTLASSEVAPSPAKKVGIPKEIADREARVAATPETVKKLQKLGFEVLIESGAGDKASFSDSAYQQSGCQIIANAAELWQRSDIVLKVREPQHHPEENCHEADLMRQGGTLISFIWPAQNGELVERLATKDATVIAMDSIPRITRAQKMDALSSMANIAGYRAVIEAANHFGRFFTGQITAAGKVPPCKVLVIGAGVAGLAAIGAARSLGAIVRAFDTRPVVKEQVESMGAEFLELEFEEDGTGQGGYAKTMSPEFIAAEMALFAEQAKEVDIIITTALIPGKKAPLLVKQEAVELMKPGSVVVDMAAAQGGNCEVTRPNEIYQYNGVTIIGLTNLNSRMASQSSQLYGTNLYHLLSDMGGSEHYRVDREDAVVRGALVLHDGEVTWPAPKPSQPAPAPAQPQAKAAPVVSAEPSKALSSKASSSGNIRGILLPVLAVAGLAAVGIGAPSSFLSHFTVFVLACFVGWQVIWNVKPALHTPLMSVTNAISGIIIIGGMLQISGELTGATTILGALAIFVGTLNISGGFSVTQRMLNMFRK